MEGNNKAMHDALESARNWCLNRLCNARVKSLLKDYCRLSTPPSTSRRGTVTWERRMSRSGGSWNIAMKTERNMQSRASLVRCWDWSAAEFVGWHGRRCPTRKEKRNEG